MERTAGQTLTREEKAAAVMAAWQGKEPCFSCGAYVAKRPHGVPSICTVCKRKPVACSTCGKFFLLHTIRWYRSWQTADIITCCGYCRRRLGIHKCWMSPLSVPQMASGSDWHRRFIEDNL